MSIKLRDLIRAVRACKTAAEERAVITKECALIRTAIKEEDEQFRHRNVAKLMYIHMLGYPTHFGQMECLKLVSAVSFPEKRIGYLGLVLLLNEQAEVLTLVTNSLKLDLCNHNQYIQALSLTAIGNLATQDMARDLISDVEKLLKNGSPYLKKKAALATIRLLKKEPDLVEHTTDLVAPLLKERAHGILITTLQLLADILVISPEQKVNFEGLVPQLVRMQRNFMTMGFSVEHDVSGITDPFMQVKILALLGLLGAGSAEATEQMADTLAQVATNTESAKNSGNAILYECVKTIMGIESDSGLKALAINILGRFLLNRDNNIRYVALNSLLSVVNEDNNAVQRHRATIVECLKDPDISIRTRALELTYQLVNPSNVELLTTELLNYLVVCQSDQKASLVNHIMSIVEKFAPTVSWRINTIITLLSIAGKFCEDADICACVMFISQANGLHKSIVHRIYLALQEDTSQNGFLHVGIWCIGEFGDLLLTPCPVNDILSVPASAIRESDLVMTLSRFMRLHNSEIATKSLILNAFLKLTAVVTPACRNEIISCMEPYRHSMNLELQQRSNEYKALLNRGDWDKLRQEVLAKMPTIDENSCRKLKEKSLMSAGMETVKPAALSNSSASNANYLDIFGGETMSTVSAPAKSSTALSIFDSIPAAPSGSSANILADVFNSTLNVSSNLPSAPVSNGASLLDIFGASPAPVPSSQPTLVNDIFGLGSISPTPISSAPVNMMGLGQPLSMSPTPAPAAAPSQHVIDAYNKAGLVIVMYASKPDPTNNSVTKLVVKFSNTSGQAFSGLVFQAAVPKYMKLEMQPPNSTVVAANSHEQVTQDVIITNSMQGEKSIVLKLKLSYSVGGKIIEEMASVSNFPALY